MMRRYSEWLFSRQSGGMPAPVPADRENFAGRRIMVQYAGQDNIYDEAFTSRFQSRGVP